MAENIADTNKKTAPTVQKEFNKRARNVTELEAKFLVQSHAMDVDLKLFTQIEKYFRKKGWIGPEEKNIGLISRQLDREDKSLLAKGHSVRIRGNCNDHDLSKIKRVDVCIKTGKTSEQSGAMCRGEYEEEITDFWRPDLNALRAKYSEKEYPELHGILNDLNEDDLIEHFRIDCNRQRYVLDVPDTVTKLKGRKFVTELMLDEIRYVLDHPALPVPIPFHYEMEVECEVLFKACAYDDNPASKKLHSDKGLTKAETKDALEKVIHHIKKAANGRAKEDRIKPTRNSKAERGFLALERLEYGMLKYISDKCSDKLPEAQRVVKEQGFLSTLFNIGRLGIPANDNLAQRIGHIVSRRFAESIEKRPIAVRKMAV